MPNESRRFVLKPGRSGPLLWSAPNEAAPPSTMHLSPALFALHPPAAFRLALRRALVEARHGVRFQDLWKLSVQLYVPSERLPGGASPMLRLMLRLFDWNCAAYKALLACGISDAVAARLIHGANWQIIGPIARLIHWAAGLFSHDALDRVRIAYDAMFRLVFTQPFQRRVILGGVDVRFHVTRCPFNELFDAHGVPGLTAQAACALDLDMAKEWNVSLSRSATIAGGQAICEFCFSRHGSALS
ncbi:L-2-amino-thiazoline-4-carboxylic acid hydrolase [Dyella subtropica]|uniref:L-2-amino-thiazoline-4-carboxylic acid hydrolase n=1 Tax=Dyella subtropica TaxID=2992127 RepID=UPI002255BB64|nr:L-2-amino-thiazoline-4-carboxylic acid hydrolase [Dyella subtropica]